MVLALANQSLLSGGKLAESGYVTVCNVSEVNVYNGQTATITLSEDAIMKRWRCQCTILWRITFRAQVKRPQHKQPPTKWTHITQIYEIPVHHPDLRIST